MVPRRKCCLSSTGLCLGIFCLVIGFYWEQIFYKILEKQLVIRPNSLIYDLWHSPPMRITVDLYMFNWTNPEDFRNPAIKPKFEELGPYRFSEIQEKVNTVWNTENSSVSYQKKSVYHFHADESNGSLDDIVTTINSVAFSIASVAKDFPTTTRTMAELAMMMYPRDLTLRKTVDELLFTGFSDTLLSIANILPKSRYSMPYDRFGYCYGRNDSPNFFGDFNVHTGKKSFIDIGQMATWNFKYHSDAYPKECSKILGSAGEFLGPYRKPGKGINIFAREFCRHMPLEYAGKTKVDDVEGYKYIGGLQAIDNGTIYAENACFCNGECLPIGVLNVSACWFNTPFFASYPHFYKADPYYLQEIEGMNPQKEKHEFSYIVEPTTSIGLEITARSQTNILVQSIPRSRMFHDVRRVMFPLFWGEAHTRLTPDLLDYFRGVKFIVFSGQIIAGLLCIFFIILPLWHPVVYFIRSKFQPHLENQDFEPVQDFKSTTANDNETGSTESQCKDVVQNKKSIIEMSMECSQPLLLK